MSTCISRHGEFSKHILDENYVCTRCIVLDEDAFIAQLAQVRQMHDEAVRQYQRLTAALEDEAHRIFRDGHEWIDGLQMAQWFRNLLSGSVVPAPELEDGMRVMIDGKPYVIMDIDFDKTYLHHQLATPHTVMLLRRVDLVEPKRQGPEEVVLP